MFFIAIKRLGLLLISVLLLCSGVGLFGLLCTSPSSATLKQSTINDLVPFNTVTSTPLTTIAATQIRPINTPTPKATNSPMPTVVIIIVTVIPHGYCVPLFESQYPCEQH